MMRRMEDRLFSFCVLSVLVAYGIGVYWWFFDYQLFPVDALIEEPYVSSFSGGPPELDHRAGDRIVLNWNIDVLRSCPADFSRSLVHLDTQKVTALAEHHGIQPGERGPIKYASTLHLPALLETGDYEYRLRGSFTCNPLESHIIRYPPVPFRIIE